MTRDRVQRVNALVGALILIVAGLLMAVFHTAIVTYIADKIRAEPASASRQISQTAQTLVLWVGVLFVLLGIAELWLSIARLWTDERDEPVALAPPDLPLTHRLAEAGIVLGGIVTGLIGIYFALDIYSMSDGFFDRSQSLAALPLLVAAIAFGLLAIGVFRRRP